MDVAGHLKRRGVAMLGARLVAASVLGFAIAGCQQTGPTLGGPDPAIAGTPATGENPGDVKYYPSDEPLRLGAQRFSEGEYGLAQRYFQDAVEKSPKDATAWVGLAASYDRLARFDLADRAYRSAIRLVGETVSILNDEGYSYMLRGDLVKARAKLRAALKRDPNNQTVLNNLALLDSSSKYVTRAPE